MRMRRPGAALWRRWCWAVLRLAASPASAVVSLAALAAAGLAIALAPLRRGGGLDAGDLIGPGRVLADLHRRVAGEALGRPVPSPYRPGPPALADPANRRDALWFAAHTAIGLAVLPLTFGLYVAVGAVGASGVDTWTAGLLWAAMVMPVVAVAFLVMLAVDHIQLLLADMLLRRPPGALERRVEELTASRAEAVDAQAAELRRIERDLHDGAQARLAAVGMTLGLARQLLRTDPEKAAALVDEARADAGHALGELRDLVRGVHPPVLADRGLVGGIEAAALLCPLPVDVHAELPGRPPPPVESALYFAAAEALANIGRHSGASRAAVDVRHVHGLLRVTVHDDGRGGADPARGSGLHGIQRRLAAFDGAVHVTSPAGGPTTVTMELPCQINLPRCASSSPRTRPSSATG